MTTATTTFVVTVAWDGDEATGEVYSTADSRTEGNEMATRLMREVPGCYAEVMTWEEAEELGLVS